MTIKVHLPCRARGQERVQRCGYAAFCLNSQKGEQQDRRGDYPRISTNPRLGDLHRHRREALRAPGPAAGRRRLPPVAFQGVLGDLVNNQVPPLFRIYIKSDHLYRTGSIFGGTFRLGKVKRCESVQVFCVETCNTNAKTRKSFVVPRKRLARITKSLSLPSLPSRKGPSLRGTFPVNLFRRPNPTFGRRE